jgi:hypothetical protein
LSWLKITSSILKNKIEKDNFGENHKKKQTKKNHVEKNCSNQQCFKEKKLQN